MENNNNGNQNMEVIFSQIKNHETGRDYIVKPEYISRVCDVYKSAEDLKRGIDDSSIEITTNGKSVTISIIVPEFGGVDEEVRRFSNTLREIDIFEMKPTDDSSYIKIRMIIMDVIEREVND